MKHSVGNLLWWVFPMDNGIPWAIPKITGVLLILRTKIPSTQKNYNKPATKDIDQWRWFAGILPVHLQLCQKSESKGSRSGDGGGLLEYCSHWQVIFCKPFYLQNFNMQIFHIANYR